MSTEIKTINGFYQESYKERIPRVTFHPAEIHLTRFYGGKDKGSMLQLTINSDGPHQYIQLTQDQVKELIETLQDSFDYVKHPSE